MVEGNIKESKTFWLRQMIFWKILRHTIYGFYQNKIAPTLWYALFLGKLHNGRTMLHAYLVKIELQYQKANNQKSILKSKRLLAWRYKYFIKVQKLGLFYMILFKCFGLMVQKFILYSPYNSSWHLGWNILNILVFVNDLRIFYKY